MKFAFIADIHLSKYGQDKLEETTKLPERLSSIKQALYEVGNYCRNQKIGIVIIGGDIYHNKSIIYSIAQQIMLEYFEDFRDLEFWIIDGNHDLSGKGKDAISALRSFKTVRNVKWISQVEMGDDDLICIPYSYDVVNQVKTNKRRILISHFGLSEGVLNSGMSIIQDISLSDLVGKYELVLLGHYHKPQQIEREDIRLFYVGSLIQLDWGEKGEEKRFLVVDTKTLQVDSIPITQYRKHIEIEITPENRATAIQEARRAQESGAHVKLVMKESVDVSEIQDEFNIIDKTEKDITDRGISSSMSKADIHQRYMEIKGVPKEKQDFFLKVGMEIVNECEEE